MYITIKYILEAPKYFLTVCTVYNGRWPDIGGGFYFRNARTGEVHLDSILYPPPQPHSPATKHSFTMPFRWSLNSPRMRNAGRGRRVKHFIKKEERKGGGWVVSAWSPFPHNWADRERDIPNLSHSANTACFQHPKLRRRLKERAENSSNIYTFRITESYFWI